MILCDWGEIRGSLDGLELKKIEKKRRKSRMKGHRAPRLPEPIRTVSICQDLACQSSFGALAYQSATLPTDLVLSLSFCTSSQVMYPTY